MQCQLELSKKHELSGDLHMDPQRKFDFELVRGARGRWRLADNVMAHFHLILTPAIKHSCIATVILHQDCSS